jgi:hypothetical protein
MRRRRCTEHRLSAESVDALEYAAATAGGRQVERTCGGRVRYDCVEARHRREFDAEHGVSTTMTRLSESALLGPEFVLLIACSIVAPVLVYWLMWSRRRISRGAVVLFGISLIVLAGIDVGLLRILASLASRSHGGLDYAVFNSELSIALYVLPTLFAGTGINLVTHVLIQHVAIAERRLDDAQQRRDPTNTTSAIGQRHDAHE